MNEETVDFYEEENYIDEQQVDEQSPKRAKKARRKQKKKARRRRMLLVLVILVLVFGADTFRRIIATFNAMRENVETIDMRGGRGIVLGETPISVLILGLDDGRSDSLMVATINPNTNTTYLLSIARDTYVPIIGHGTSTRINHAFAYGGAAMARDTVQKFLNIPIDFHVSMQMDGFAEFVDAVGIINVYNNTVDFSMGGHHFPLGQISLTGEQALYYSRMRMDDPRGDFGRQERQRDIIGALASELTSISGVTRYQRILDASGNNLRTDVSMGQMLAISFGYNAAVGNITNLQLIGAGQTIHGMALIVVADDELQAMSNRLRSHLELD